MLGRAEIPFAEVPVRPIFAGEESKLRAWHVATIGWLVGRAFSRRLLPHLGMARGNPPYYSAGSRSSEPFVPKPRRSGGLPTEPVSD